MSLILKDRVRETSTVSGTNDATLLGAVTGFQSFSAVGNGNTCYYCIADQSGGSWEVGIGTYSNIGPTLTRDTILSSSNSGSKVVFAAGSKDVFLTYPSEVAVLQGTSVSFQSIIDSALTSGRVTYAGTSGVLKDSANLTFDGTTLTANALAVTNGTTITGGTANGVAYLNGSKVLTTGSALTFDGTSLSTTGAVSIKTANYMLRFFDATGVTSRGYIWSTSSDFQLDTGSTAPLEFFINGSEGMRLTSTGLGIGTSSPSYKLDVAGAARSDSWIGRSNTSAPTTDAFIYRPADNTLGFGTGSTERMRLDSSGNLGLGVTPSAWVSTVKAVQFGYNGSLASRTGGNGTYLSSNVYFSGDPSNSASNGVYIGTTAASTYLQSAGQHSWYTAPSGTAGNAISFTQAMTLDASGNLGLGTASPVSIAGYTIETINNGTTGSGVYLQSAGTDRGRFLANSTATYIGARNGLPLILESNATEAMRIDSSGNVGIGTSSPGYTLQVGGGSADTRILVNSNDSYGIGFKNTANTIGGWIGSPAAQTLAFFSYAGTERMRIDSSGNVGIGTSGSYNRLSSVVSATGAIPTSEAIGVSSGNPNTPIGEWNQSDSATFSGIALETRTTGASRWLIANQWTNTYLGDLVFVRRTGGTTSAEAMRIDSSGVITSGLGGMQVISGTSVSASGTSVTFSGIPSWVKRITVMFSGVSLSGTSNLLVRLGTSGGIVSSGYYSAVLTGSGASDTSGFIVTNSNTAASNLYGAMTITNVTSNSWVETTASIRDATGTPGSGSGGVTLSGALTQIRITTVNGTDTFDAGTINILYE